ncbi:MAG: transcriptional regulator [Proteobacteria bacterium]|nr:transcriptional regulator [Pseudomonadota bacterium]
MRKNLVITLTGHDRVGIVEQLTKLVLDRNGNVRGSRMARLGGEFALMMLVSLSAEDFDDLREAIRGLREEGFKVATSDTERRDPSKYAGWMPYRVELKGADHEGILYNIAHHLAEAGINIETMDTNTVKAPMSGIPLFTMVAIVVVPPQLQYHDWHDALEEIGDRQNVEIDVSPYTG